MSRDLSGREIVVLTLEKLSLSLELKDLLIYGLFPTLHSFKILDLSHFLWNMFSWFLRL